MRTSLLALVMTLLGSTAPISWGQASPCLPADTISTSVINNLNQLLTSTEPTEVNLKNSLGLNNVSPSQLTLVTTGTDCTKARQAVDILFNTPNSSRRMHVVKAGSKRFVVKDQNGEALFVFDNKWVHVKTVSPG